MAGDPPGNPLREKEKAKKPVRFPPGCACNCRVGVVNQCASGSDRISLILAVVNRLVQRTLMNTPPRNVYSRSQQPAVRGFLLALAWIFTVSLGQLAMAEVHYAFMDLGHGSGDTISINDAGQVAFTVATANYPGSVTFSAVVYTPGVGITDLGNLGGKGSVAFDINSSGQVVGHLNLTNGDEHAFLYTPGTGMVDLGTLPGIQNTIATGINNLGEVVGYTGGVGGGTSFAWSAGSGMVDLGATLQILSGMNDENGAGAINDAGVVVGEIGVTTAYEWSPVSGLTLLSADGNIGADSVAINSSGTGGHDNKTTLHAWRRHHPSRLYPICDQRRGADGRPGG